MKFVEESDIWEICRIILKSHCKIICNNCGFTSDYSVP